MGTGYWDGLTKRLYSIYDQERANQMAVSDFKDPRSEWYAALQMGTLMRYFVFRSPGRSKKANI